MGTVRGTRPVPIKFGTAGYPNFVTFANIRDPLSARFVSSNDLAASLGRGYKLHSLTVEITDEPVTKGRIGTVLTPAFFDRWKKVEAEKKEAIRAAEKDPKSTLFEDYYSTDFPKLKTQMFIRAPQ